MSYWVLECQVHLAWSLSEDHQAQDFTQLEHIDLFLRLWWEGLEESHFEAGPTLMPS